MNPADGLIEWFERDARLLPWRTTPRDPYLSLVSEIMLQQTQVDRIVGRFEAFIDRFPTIQALAVADDDEVLALWSGLGYYRRARMLHSLARVVCREHGGRLPAETDALRSLPGVGDYTAAAVASMVWGRAEPVVDGNVRRVGARVLGFDGEPRSADATRLFKAWVLQLMDGQSPGVVNEALMELGATVCLPRDPGCPRCPLAPGCVARAQDRVHQVPAPRAVRVTEHLRWVSACCVRGDGRWLVRQVDSGPILRGLWLTPVAELSDGFEPGEVAATLLPARVGEAVFVGPSVSHSITHRRIEVIPVLFDGNGLHVDAATWRWARPGDGRIATSSLLEKLWKALKKPRAGPDVEINALRQEK